MNKLLKRAGDAAFYVLAGLLVICSVILMDIGLGLTAADASLYPSAGVVYAIDRTEDIVYWTDGAGRLWSFYGAEDWMVGDGIACIMDSNGTQSVYDDAIVTARYTG